jgi:hypothetical protein
MGDTGTLALFILHKNICSAALSLNYLLPSIEKNITPGAMPI